MGAKKAIGLVLGFFLLVTGVGAAIYLLARSSGLDAAEYLPKDTIAYIRYSNLDTVWDALEETETVDHIVDELEIGARQPDLADLVEEIDEKSKHVSAVHVTFHGMSARRPLLMALLELRTGKPLDDILPEELMDRLDEAGDHKGVEVYELENRNDLPVGLFAAGLSDMVVLSTDENLLEETIEAIQAGGRETSLADNETFRQARGEFAGNDVATYIAVDELVKTIEDALDDYNRRQFSAVARALGLDDVMAVATGSGYESSEGQGHIVIDEDHPAYQILHGAGAEKRVLEFCPGDTIFVLSLSVEDGEKTWSEVKELIRDFASTAPHGRDRFDRTLDEFEDETGIDPSAAAELVQEIGFFIYDQPGDENVALVIHVTDEDEAREMLEDAEDVLARTRFRTDRCEGTRVRTTKDFSWAVCDAVVLLGGPDAVEAAIEAHEDGNNLTETKRFDDVVGRLPDRSALLWYADIGVLTEQAQEEKPEDLSKAVSDLLEAIACGGTVTAADGIIKLYGVQNRVIKLSEKLAAFKDLAELEPTRW